MKNFEDIKVAFERIWKGSDSDAVKIRDTEKLIKPSSKELETIWQEKSRSLNIGDELRDEVTRNFLLLAELFNSQIAGTLGNTIKNSSAALDHNGINLQTAGAIIKTFFQSGSALSQCNISVGSFVRAAIDAFTEVSYAKPAVPQTVLVEIEQSQAWAAKAAEIRRRMSLPDEGKS